MGAGCGTDGLSAGGRHGPAVVYPGGPDPLHVVAVFGVHAITANRYVDAVRSRVEAAAAMEQVEEADS